MFALYQKNADQLVQYLIRQIVNGLMQLKRTRMAANAYLVTCCQNLEENVSRSKIALVSVAVIL